ncbi:phospholipid/cholesterol/gamma-HCH transport system substrate-binding protein [Xylanibacter ruminicola]|jgi:phospholipid/cholesterol/gamma-HCH transport system substrate-binding protein|uniref:Phospholipid/cholesterol/gamma-HCH transport system substrate-binding protein n=1 Tax=Xylanibacter ruminicola TaxID=839 RepID=A0A1H5RRM9_XYLRU|nr:MULTISPECIES: MlaD family protein [Prevotellaceae]SEF41012.1 phospholipid/cholesterol/gamma-HCH transport system substrate-binding protein [Xylanibacter ruminicola]SEW10918.1 phospholipid/cholesterol/gamma-HCH transport system substrate-binding protein [Prevotella sp. khp7]
MKKLSKEVQIALVAIVGIVVLYVGLQFLKGMTLFSTDNSYYVKFQDVSGLSVASPIYANGYRVGVVEEIVYNYQKTGDIVAQISIDNKLAVPADSRAEICTDMMGNVKVELKLGSASAIASGDTICGGQQLGALGQAAGMIPQIQQMLPKLDSILASVNTLLADPAIANSLHHVDQITANLTKTSQDLNRLTASLNQQMPQILKNADGVLANTNQLTESLNNLDIATTMVSVNTTLKNVEQMTAKLNSTEGTLGLLMRDPSLYSNLNATMMHADSLMIDLKTHPKRYVHFSVFGRKND